MIVRAVYIRGVCGTKNLGASLYGDSMGNFSHVTRLINTGGIFFKNFLGGMPREIGDSRGKSSRTLRSLFRLRIRDRRKKFIRVWFDGGKIFFFLRRMITAYVTSGKIFIRTIQRRQIFFFFLTLLDYRITDLDSLTRAAYILGYVISLNTLRERLFSERSSLASCGAAIQPNNFFIRKAVLHYT